MWRQTKRKLPALLQGSLIAPPNIQLVHDFDPNFQTDTADCFAGHLAISSDDSLVAGSRLSAAVQARVAVLCFASRNIPGGAVASGVNAQEESLYRRCSVSLALNPDDRPDCYPMPGGRCVLVSQVAVVRGPDHEWLQTPFAEIDMIASAAVSKPPLLGDGYADNAEMHSRVLSVLQTARQAGVRFLVLGAWGCGGFRNPVLGLAQLFRQVLIDEGCGVWFEYVEFAIPAPKFADVFREVISDVLVDPIGVV
jgi:uncharacterized protein (TIGR02452 family)